ncbi:antirestriction protein [Escherichia coli]|nr:antirestriction protein [Escherichia coli]
MKTFIKTLLVAVTILFSVFATAKQVKLPNNIKYVNTTEAFSCNRAEMSPEAAGIAACLMTYSHHACRTECYAMTVHYYRLRDYALQHPECSAIMRIID